MRKILFLFLLLPFLVSAQIRVWLQPTKNNYDPGERITIRWNYSGISDSARVKITLWREGANQNFCMVAQNISISRRSYTWTIPSTCSNPRTGASEQLSGGRIRVRVRWQQHNVWGESPFFRVSSTTRSLSVSLSPSRSTYTEGETVLINWNYSGIPSSGKVIITIWEQGRSPNICRIERNVPIAQRSYKWTVVKECVNPFTGAREDLTSGQFRIRVRWQGGNVYDESQNFVVNTAAPGLTELELIPSKAVYREGETVRIKWKSMNLPSSAKVRITIWRPHGGINICRIAADLPASRGSYSWTVPSSCTNLHTGATEDLTRGQIKIRVRWQGHQSWVESPFFSVEAVPSGTLSAQLLPQQMHYRAGEKITLKWTSTGLDSSQLLTVFLLERGQTRPLCKIKAGLRVSAGATELSFPEKCEDLSSHRTVSLLNKTLVVRLAAERNPSLYAETHEFVLIKGGPQLKVYVRDTFDNSFYHCHYGEVCQVNWQHLYFNDPSSINARIILEKTDGTAICSFSAPLSRNKYGIKLAPPNCSVNVGEFYRVRVKAAGVEALSQNFKVVSRGLANLFISKITCETGPPISEDSVKIIIKVANDGEVSSKPALINILLSKPHGRAIVSLWEHRAHLPTISAGGSAEVSVIAPLYEGQIRIDATADSSGIVEESNESDNRKNTICELEYKGQPKIYHFSILPSTVSRGSSVTFKWHVFQADEIRIVVASTGSLVHREDEPLPWLRDWNGTFHYRPTSSTCYKLVAVNKLSNGAELRAEKTACLNVR